VDCAPRMRDCNGARAPAHHALHLESDLAELDEDLVEQSREQYLRCALSICSECVEDGVQRPEQAAAAIDVLCVLFEE